MFDVTLLGAVIAGLLSFLSPCVLPIVPFYLSYLAGVGIKEVHAGSTISRATTARAFLAACSFSFGVIAVFVGLGASATLFGSFIREYFDVLRWLAAVIVIAMGLHFLGVIRIGVLDRQLRVDAGDPLNVSLVGAFVIGLAFAFGWSPCVGPVLSAILFTAAGQETAGQGAVLLFAYGVGMTFPFIVATLFLKPFLSWVSRFRHYLGVVEKLIGLFLIMFGVLIATNAINIIAQFMLVHLPWFGSIG